VCPTGDAKQIIETEVYLLYLTRYDKGTPSFDDENEISNYLKYPKVFNKFLQ